MRTLIIALALGSAALAMPAAPPAAAQTLHYYARWCSQIPENNTECTFATEQQCLETIAGNGGYCETNPGFAEGSPFASERRGRYRRHG